MELAIGNLQRPNREEDFADLIADIEISSEEQRTENDLARELDRKKMPAFEDVPESRISAIDADGETVAGAASRGAAVEEPQDELDRMIASIN